MQCRGHGNIVALSDIGLRNIPGSCHVLAYCMLICKLNGIVMLF